jgi:hypothetical protein
MLNKRVGDGLAEAGVSLFPLFGMYVLDNHQNFDALI